MYKLIAGSIKWIGGGLAVMTIMGVGFFACSVLTLISKSVCLPTRPEDMLKMRQIIYALKPAIEVIESFKTVHGSLPSPDQFQQLPIISDEYVATFFRNDRYGDSRCNYEPISAADYTLSYSLCFNTRLNYDSTTKQWSHSCEGQVTNITY